MYIHNITSFMIFPIYPLYMYPYISMIPKYLYDLNYFTSIYKYMELYIYIYIYIYIL